MRSAGPSGRQGSQGECAHALDQFDPSERRWTWAFRAVFGLGLLTCLLTFLDYGLTWDEELNRIYADGILRWLQTWGVESRDALEFRRLYLYGGSFDVVAQMVGRGFPAGVYEGRHLVNVLCGLVGIWGTWRLGSLIGGPRAGFLAGVFLLLNPVYYGHAFNNPKDIPFAAASIWTLVAMFEATNELPRIHWRTIAWTGVAMGLMLGIRIGGVFHYGYLAVLWGVGLLMRYASARWDRRELGSVVPRMLFSIVAVVVVSWVLMLVAWPFGQIAPLSNPLRALSLFHGLSSEAIPVQWDGDVLFNGRFVRSTDAPWTYLPGYFAVSLPEFYYLGLVCGLVALATALRRGRLRGEAAHRIGTLGLIAVFPVAAAIVFGSTLYDGLRHFLFLMPPLAVLSGYGVSAAWGALANRWSRAALASVLAVLLGSVLVDMVQLHPYQSVYFNRAIAGGLQGAAGRFETDYWGQSYKEAAEWVMREYRPTTSEPIRVANCSIPFLTEYFLAKGSELGRVVDSGGRPAHILIATTRHNCHHRSSRVLEVVERQGVALAYIFEESAPLP